MTNRRGLGRFAPRRRWFWLALFAVAVEGLCFAAAVGMTFASTAPALRWSSTASFPDNPLLSVSCPSASLCVAGSGDGLLVSTHPTGSPTDWPLVIAPPASAGRAPSVYSVSCPSTSFCAAIGSDSILTSTNPAGGPSAWKVVRIALPAGASLSDLSCASATLCVAETTGSAKAARKILVSSTHPAGSASAWTINRMRYPLTLNTLACVAPHLCLVGVTPNDLLISTNPGAGARSWKAQRYGDYFITAIACASTRYCVIGSHVGASPSAQLLGETRPAGRNVFRFSIPGPLVRGAFFSGASCTPTGSCVFLAQTSNGRSTTAFMSGRPEGPWARARVGGVNRAVSCASQRFCVGVGVSVIGGTGNGQLAIARG